jgi:hypothetical protein
MITLTPAYGRDYTSKAKAIADWEAGKDFILNDFESRWNGKPVNISQLPGKVLIRYGKLRKVTQYTPRAPQ